MKKIKCANCDLEKNDDDEEFYKFEKKVYCFSCLEDYFRDDLVHQYFEQFLDDECEEIK